MATPLLRRKPNTSRLMRILATGRTRPVPSQGAPRTVVAGGARAPLAFASGAAPTDPRRDFAANPRRSPGRHWWQVTCGSRRRCRSHRRYHRRAARETSTQTTMAFRDKAQPWTMLAPGIASHLLSTRVLRIGMVSWAQSRGGPPDRSFRVPARWSPRDKGPPCP